MIAGSCAAFSASTVCFVIGSTSSTGIGIFCDPRAWPVNQFHHERRQPVGLLKAVDLRDVRMVQGDQRQGEILMATWTQGWYRAIGYIHPAHADLGANLV
jgi:hypothetical protein